MSSAACGLSEAREEYSEDHSAAITRQAPVLLSWLERSKDNVRWWETAPERHNARRGVVIWLPALGQLVWWISEHDETLAIGGLESLNPPAPALIERAMQIVEERWEG